MQTKLTVITPAVSFALAHLDTLKAELGITGTAEDAQLQGYIFQASSAITGYLGRVIAQETVAEQFRLPQELACRGGVESLPLSRCPVSVIASVVVDGVTLSASDYEVEAKSGLLWRLYSDSLGPWRGRKITVTYTGGYTSLPELPDAIERAAHILITHMRSAAGRDPQLRSESIDGVWSGQYWVGTTPGATAGLPPDVTALLEPYRAEPLV